MREPLVLLDLSKTGWTDVARAAASEARKNHARKALDAMPITGERRDKPGVALTEFGWQHTGAEPQTGAVPEHLPVEQVPMSSLRHTETHVAKDRIKHFIDNPPPDQPINIDARQGHMTVVDGAHRAAYWKLMGRRTMPAKVWRGEKGEMGKDRSDVQGN